MDLGASFSAPTLRRFREVHPLYYSDWQDIRALRRVITEVIVIALKLSWSPKGPDREDFHPETLTARLSAEN
jgi:hypothetical protein